MVDDRLPSDWPKKYEPVYHFLSTAVAAPDNSKAFQIYESTEKTKRLFSVSCLKPLLSNRAWYGLADFILQKRDSIVSFDDHLHLKNHIHKMDFEENIEPAIFRQLAKNTNPTVIFSNLPKPVKLRLRSEDGLIQFVRDFSTRIKYEKVGGHGRLKNAVGNLNLSKPNKKSDSRCNPIDHLLWNLVPTTQNSRAVSTKSGKKIMFSVTEVYRVLPRHIKDGTYGSKKKFLDFVSNHPDYEMKEGHFHDKEILEKMASEEQTLQEIEDIEKVVGKNDVKEILRMLSPSARIRIKTSKALSSFRDFQDVLGLIIVDEEEEESRQPASKPQVSEIGERDKRVCAIEHYITHKVPLLNDIKIQATPWGRKMMFKAPAIFKCLHPSHKSSFNQNIQNFVEFLASCEEFLVINACVHSRKIIAAMATDSRVEREVAEAIANGYSSNDWILPQLSSASRLRVKSIRGLTEFRSNRREEESSHKVEYSHASRDGDKEKEVHAINYSPPVEDEAHLSAFLNVVNTALSATQTKDNSKLTDTPDGKKTMFLIDEVFSSLNRDFKRKHNLSFDMFKHFISDRDEFIVIDDCFHRKTTLHEMATDAEAVRELTQILSKGVREPKDILEQLSPSCRLRVTGSKSLQVFMQEKGLNFLPEDKTVLPPKSKKPIKPQDLASFVFYSLLNEPENSDTEDISCWFDLEEIYGDALEVLPSLSLQELSAVVENCPDMFEVFQCFIRLRSRRLPSSDAKYFINLCIEILETALYEENKSALYIEELKLKLDSCSTDFRKLGTTHLVEYFLKTWKTDFFLSSRLVRLTDGLSGCAFSIFCLLNSAQTTDENSFELNSLVFFELSWLQTQLSRSCDFLRQTSSQHPKYFKILLDAVCIVPRNYKFLDQFMREENDDQSALARTEDELIPLDATEEINAAVILEDPLDGLEPLDDTGLDERLFTVPAEDSVVTMDAFGLGASFGASDGLQSTRNSTHIPKVGRRSRNQDEKDKACCVS